MEEARVKMLMAIGQAPPLNDDDMLQHLREFALEVRSEGSQPQEGGGDASLKKGGGWLEVEKGSAGLPCVCGGWGGDSLRA
jgi:hypothetical protein